MNDWTEVERLRDEIVKISSELQKEQQRYFTLAANFRQRSERLDMIEPIYRKLYEKRWVRWLYMPLDTEISGRELMRCDTCQKLFWGESEEEFTTHRGHKYRLATDGSWWEGLRLRMGWVR